MGCGASARRVAPAAVAPGSGARKEEEPLLEASGAGAEPGPRGAEAPPAAAPSSAGESPGVQPEQRPPPEAAGVEASGAGAEPGRQQAEAPPAAAASSAAEIPGEQPEPRPPEAAGAEEQKEPEGSIRAEEEEEEEEEEELLPELVEELNREFAKASPGSENHQKCLHCKAVYELMKRDWKSGALMESMMPLNSQEDADRIMAKEKEKELANREEVRRLMKDNAEAAKQAIAAGEEPLQKQVPPTCWAMTLWQWNAYVSNCMEEEEYKKLKEQKGFVTLYDLNTLFVRPQTRGAGSGVALLLNRSRPLNAQVMVSHAWGECIEECMEAFVNLCMPEDAVIWFCLFANYQPGDEPGDVGPPIGWQLSLNPFQQVIHSESLLCMVVAHTTREEVYNRLWCVHEIDEAISSNVQPWAACSFKYTQSSEASLEPLAGAKDSSIAVTCAGARCGRPEDEAAIREVVEANGGFERLDKVVLAFRRSMVEYNQMVGFFAFLQGPQFIKTAMKMVWENPAKLMPSDLQFFVQLAPMFAKLEERGRSEKKRPR